MVIGSRGLLQREGVDLGPIDDERSRIAEGGRTAVSNSVDTIWAAVRHMAVKAVCPGTR